STYEDLVLRLHGHIQPKLERGGCGRRLLRRGGGAAGAVDFLHLDFDHAGRHPLRDADVGALDGDRPLEQWIVQRPCQAQQRVYLRRDEVDLDKLRVAGADMYIESLWVGGVDMDRAGSLHRPTAGRASGELINAQA